MSESPKPESPKQLLAQNIEMAETGRVLWYAKAPAEHTLKDALHPIYLWHRHEEIEAGHKVELHHELHHFYAEFYVIKVDKETQSVILAPIVGPIDLKKTKVPKADLSQATIEHKGPHGKWCVIVGHAKLVSGLATKEEAEEWLEARRSA